MAVAAVVAYHLGYLHGGFLGVDVFFVLSGYLVTSLLLAESGGGSGIDLRAFWLARLRRLAPAVLVMVPVVLVAAMALRWPSNRLRALSIDATATLTWWENWRQIAAGQSYWDSNPSPFRHAWSLAIEEQFYVVWPLIAAVLAWLALRRVASTRRMVGALAFAACAMSAAVHLWVAHRVDDSELSRVYLGTDTRVFAILIGCALACTGWGMVADADADADADAGADGVSSLEPGGHHSERDDPIDGFESLRPRSVAGIDFAAVVSAAVLAIMTVMAQVSAPRLFREGWLLAASLLALVIVAAAATPGVSPVRTLAGRFGVTLTVPAQVASYLGLRSYGIYLWSWPIQVLAQHRWPSSPRALRSVLVVVLALAVAEASFRFVENPIRRSTGWARSRLIRRPAWGLSIMAAALAVAAGLHVATPSPVHEQLETADALALARSQPAPPTRVDDGIADGSGDPDPGPGLDGQDTTGAGGLHVLVIGDSVSFTVGYYKPGMFDLPPGIGWIDSRSVIGCGVLAVDEYQYPAEAGGFGQAAGGDCVIQAEVEALGLAEEPDVVVMLPGAWEVFAVRSPDGEVIAPMTEPMRAVLVAELVERARAADEVGAALLLVGWGCPPEGTPQDRSDPDYIVWANATFRAAATEARDRGLDARYADPGDAACAGGPTGEPTEAKRSWMGESNHVTGQESGVRLWHEWLGPLIVEAMAR